MTNKVLLFIASILIVLGLTKFDISSLIPNINPNPVSVDVVDVSPPTDSDLREKANDIVSLLKSQLDPKDLVKFSKLRDLYFDLSVLIALDGDSEVIKTTDEIRQANSMAGIMLKLDLKNKYEGLAKCNNDLVVAAIGDDAVILSSDLRAKAVDAFKALSWAYNEGCK